MKKRNDVLDLSVICIDEGMEYGKVRELIIDPEDGKVVYLIIDDGEWYLGAKLLTFEDILGIGRDAVTTQTADNIKGIREDDEVLELVKKGIRIIGSKVYTQSGEYVGLIDEYYIDEDDGTIIKCQLEGGDVISSSSVITYGKTVLVVEDDIQKGILDSDDKRIEPYTLTELQDKKSKPFSNIFEEKQRQFLLGKRATKDIRDKTGIEIVSAGQIIDEGIIEKVDAAGKLVELTMNIE